ncbi:MAG: hypothetical protein AB1861_10475 [Cyanobacteriota bacterium]
MNSVWGRDATQELAIASKSTLSRFHHTLYIGSQSAQADFV